MRKRVLAHIGASGVVWMTAAHAQAPEEASSRDGVEIVVDEIIVTGAKRGLTVQEAEVSVEIFDAERLDAENLFDIGDVIRRTPNISSGGSASDIVIRGVSRSGVGGAGQGVTSNVYIDNAPLSDGALFFGQNGLWDVAQVEVLRGPQSTVQGRNALAGSIVIVTKDPTYEWEAAARIRYGERNERQFAGVVSGPIIDDQLAFRIAVDRQATDGFSTFAATNEPATSQDSILVRGKLLAEPVFMPGFRGEFIAEYGDNARGRGGFEIAAGQTGPDGAEPLPVTDPAFAEFDFFAGRTFITPQLNEIETLRLIADITQELSPNWRLRAIGAYEDYDRTRTLGDLDNPAQFIENAFDEQETRTYSGEARFEFDYGRLSGGIGGYYFKNSDFFLTENVSRFNRFVDFPIDPPTSLIFSNSSADTDVENFAFYGQIRFDIDDHWTIDAALRYDNEQFETRNLLPGAIATASEGCFGDLPGELIGLPGTTLRVDCNTIISFGAGGQDNPPERVRFDAFLPRAAITYNITRDLSIFASVQRGYRAGGTFLEPSEAGAVLGTFGPEFLTNYEVGFRSQWLDGRLSFNGNFFYGRISDQQVSIANEAVLLPRIENAGSSELFGADFAADFQVTGNLNFYGSLGLLETEFTDFQFAREGVPFENLAGNVFALAPNITLTVGGSYEHRTGLFTDASVNFAGPSEASVLNLDADVIGSVLPGLDERLDARATVNARIGYRNDQFSLAVFADNLLDDRSRTDAFLGGISTVTGAFNPNDNPSQTYVLPRTIGVVLDIRI